MTSTHGQQAEPEPSIALGWCAWHKEHVTGVRLIVAIEQGSGAGGNLFACPQCIDAHRLTPLADRP